MNRIALALALSTVVACSGSSNKGTTGPGTGTGNGNGNGNGAVSDAGDSNTPAAARTLTVDECSQVFDHVLAIGVEEMRQTKPPEEVPTPQQIAQIKKGLMEREIEKCQQQPKSAYDCAMASKTAAALGKCDSGG